jgi:hypothetical protein
VDDEVRHVAVDEQLTREEADDLVGGDPAVGTADPEKPGRLLSREPLKECRLAPNDLGGPGSVVGEEFVESGHGV